MFNDTDILDFLIVATPVLFGTTVMFAVLWVRARERALRARINQPHPDALSEDLTHVVQAVDAIAIEVERISEAQRFTALTLAGRSDAKGGGKRVPERIITPH